MLESTVWRLAIALLIAVALIALIGYVRGPHSHVGREPDIEHAGPAALVLVPSRVRVATS